MKRPPYLCENRQCRACVEYSINYKWCNYGDHHGKPRLCPIPFCEYFDLRPGKRVPQHLTPNDFKAWYRSYGGEQNWLIDKYHWLRRVRQCSITS